MRIRRRMWRLYSGPIRRPGGARITASSSLSVRPKDANFAATLGVSHSGSGAFAATAATAAATSSRDLSNRSPVSNRDASGNSRSTIGTALPGSIRARLERNESAKPLGRRTRPGLVGEEELSRRQQVAVGCEFGQGLEGHGCAIEAPASENEGGKGRAIHC
jgi:hypothetical protein